MLKIFFGSRPYPSHQNFFYPSIIFYFLKDGARWRKAIVILSPLSDRDDEKIISRLKLAVNGVIKGYLLVALVQGLLMGIGLSFFGVPHPALWGVVAAIASLIPMIGTALVSIPAFIFLFLTPLMVLIYAPLPALASLLAFFSAILLATLIESNYSVI